MHTISSTSPHVPVPVPVSTATYCVCSWEYRRSTPTKSPRQPIVDTLQVVAIQGRDFQFLNQRTKTVQDFTELRRLRERCGYRLNHFQFAYSTGGLERTQRDIYFDLRATDKSLRFAGL